MMFFIVVFSKGYKFGQKEKTSQKIVHVWIQRLNLKNIYKNKYIQIYFWKFEFSFFFHKNCVIDVSFFLLASQWKDQIHFSIRILQSVKNEHLFAKISWMNGKNKCDSFSASKKLVLKPWQRFDKCKHFRRWSVSYELGFLISELFLLKTKWFFFTFFIIIYQYFFLYSCIIIRSYEYRNLLNLLFEA